MQNKIAYFVNPYHNQPILSQIQQKSHLISIQQILAIQSYQRSTQQKQSLFYFFNQNDYLKRIQRKKSLNARIKCIDQIKITKKNRQKIHYDSQKNQQMTYKQQSLKRFTQIILFQFPQTNNIAFIRPQKIAQILSQSQQSIKSNINFLKRYNLTKKMYYHQLLYLSNFIEFIECIKYKQFVVRQNQQSDYVYFIDEGQFQIIKDIEFQQVNNNLGQGRKYNLKVKTRKQQEDKILKMSQKDFMQQDQSPFKNKAFKVIKEQLAKIQGNSGQCVGEIQLFLQKQSRLFSFRCNSTNAKVYRINFKYFRQTFKYSLEKFRLLQKEYQLKYENLLNKISGFKYSSNGVLNIAASRIYKLKSNNLSNQNIQKRLINSNKLTEIIGEMQRFKTYQNQSLLEEMILNKSANYQTIVNKERRSSYSKNYKKLQESRHRFSKSTNNKSPKQYCQKFEQVRYEKQDISNQERFLPLIRRKAFSKNQDSINNNDRSFDNVSLIKKNHPSNDLLDIDMIIKEKQILFQSKSKSRQQCFKFSFYKQIDPKIQRKIIRKQRNQKQLKNTITSAHSPQFMKSLIKDSLFKSGYVQYNSQKADEKNIQLSFALQKGNKNTSKQNKTIIVVKQQNNERKVSAQHLINKRYQKEQKKIQQNRQKIHINRSPYNKQRHQKQQKKLQQTGQKIHINRSPQNKQSSRKKVLSRNNFDLFFCKI